MRIRFTIRDLFWLTLVVALATGWWLEHMAIRNERALLKQRLAETAEKMAALVSGYSDMSKREWQLRQKEADVDTAIGQKREVVRAGILTVHYQKISDRTAWPTFAYCIWGEKGARTMESVRGCGSPAIYDTVFAAPSARLV